MKRQSSTNINESDHNPCGLLWVKIENSNDINNQAFKIEVSENDTVDDLKDKILERLNNTRWKSMNDNASISLGVYTISASTSIPQQSNYLQQNHSIDVDSLNSPVDIIPNLFQKQSVIASAASGTTSATMPPDSSILTPQPSIVLSKLSTSIPINTNNTNGHPNNMISSMSPKTFNNIAHEEHVNYIETSPQRACSTSPKLISVPKASIVRPSSVTLSQATTNNNNNNSTSLPHLSNYISTNNRAYTQARLSPNDFTHQLSQVQQKHARNIEGLRYSTELVNRTNLTYRVIFQPDELAKNIRHHLFNNKQTASDPIFIFSNSTLSLERGINSISNSNTKTEKPLLSLKPIDVTNNYMHIGRTITPIEIGESSENPYHVDVNANNGDDDNENEVQTSSPNEFKTYKLITNEKQLKEASDLLSNEDQVEGMETSPKQAILLLPKGYVGDHHNGVGSHSLNEELGRSYENQKDIQEAITSQLNTTKSHSSTSSTENLPKSLEVSLQGSDTTAFIQQHHHVPLNEQEVGLIDPMIENEWHKKTAHTHNDQSQDQKQQGTEKTDSQSSTEGDSPVTKPHVRILPKDRPIPHPIRAHPKSATSSSSAQKSTSERVFPKINVLIVEDNVINQAILGSFLRKHKISYKVANNGKEAVDIWKEGGLHLIFMDLQLPVLSGIEAAKQIRNCEKEQKKGTSNGSGSPPVIIVALTASNSIEDKRNALISGCNDYLTKPVNLHWLSKKITEWGCMQALIDFDSWKQGQSRMTDSFLNKVPKKVKMGVIS
ncbi:similar to Saccharomyces cerevisiae YLR006C SSK1 Cytoplasmic response regulator [Maudiozyma barnettii]|uniref:Similar to Saccharomyces cerevisiae YLR006C SSK1 Cytoplasmic response regulator n=1 Tax=Maudiozyma barnettii TaxID=61262 RepID=A0A8H2VC65_9SACH|nr:mitogen-activated protein kinase kinase kinase SSK1 [Kazachstania barnettii]CAB4252571.1 similar to Saccharomyces cerevisiae YLR006C SSK1 Cytoplasmic response regulator [Kazachstania barnettii]CAD1779309.1 similar to Saccharomyces cerevisiae YLR006C SSK1 Cytoplasmic response regulator [Kazachstania barnettii]